MRWSQWKSTAGHMGEGNMLEEATVATILHVNSPSLILMHDQNHQVGQLF